MRCPKCETHNVQGARFCVNCGRSLTRTSNRKRWWLTGISIAFCLVWAAVIFIYYQMNDPLDEKASSPDGSVLVESQTEAQEKSKATFKAETKDDPPPKAEQETSSPSQEATQKKQPEQKGKTEIIRDVQTKVFTIITKDGLGSGFLFQKNGMVVTNAHVVAGYTDVIVRDTNDREVKGRVIGISNKFDVALIRVDDLAGTDPLEIENNQSEIGTEVIALGSPQGLDNTASIGYLTGLGRSFESEFQYENVYQIDAQVSPGSSGGPLVDAKTGKVIGINSVLLKADDSIAFSIPMYTMADLLTTWSNSPMSASEVTNVFSFYDEYALNDESDYNGSEGNSSQGSSNDGSNGNREEYKSYFDESSLTTFIKSFRDDYEKALKYEDFSYIEDELLHESVAYLELADYLDEVRGKGMIFDFTSNEVTNVDIHPDHAVASTYEVFDFMNAAGGWSVYERVKDYTVIIDENGHYKITRIDIHK